ncbi:MAG: SLC13 family permease [Proteobacteria bacterium]|nr:SLC13 family permease [Pseudomonadota bacterium]
MNWEAWTTLGLIVAMMVAMVRNLAGPDLVLMAGLATLLALGIVTPAEAFAGFSNQGMLSIAVLLVVAAGMRETGALELVVRGLLGRPRSLLDAQLRMMLPVCGVSAFLNNTPVVAMMVPIVLDWSRRIGQSPSKLLIPLSYAAIVGGSCTLIGTATNLIVYGLTRARYPEMHVGMFEISALGLPVCVAAVLYVLVASRAWLPARETARHKLEDAREYTVAMRIEPGSPVIGRTIEGAGLRHLPGLFLVEIERSDGELRPAPGPEVRLHQGDRLLFTGVIDSVVDLRKVRGLVLDEQAAHKLSDPRPTRRLVEAVVAPASSLVNQSVRAAGFRTRYSAAIVAVHRQGERIASKIGDIVLQAGDTLLLETHPSFVETFRDDTAFALVAEVAGSTPLRHDRAWWAIALLVALVASNTMGLLPLVVAALLTAGAMLATGCLTGTEARQALDLRVLLTIAAALGVGAALEASGAAGQVAQIVVGAAAPFGPIGLVAAVYIVTVLLNAVATTQAAAVLMFPVVVAAVDSLQLDFRPFMFTLMLASSASFMTPIGYPTNLMVYGPGHYRFSDFTRFGGPLQVLAAAVTVTMAWLLWL